MMPCCRIPLFVTISIFLLSPLPSDNAFAEQQDRENAQDKPQEMPPAQPQPHPETQLAPPKLLTEPKPQSAPAAKPEAPPKLSTEPKAQPQTAPPAKPEPPTEREAKEKEKEKEREKEKEAQKKPVGSLILTVKLALLADVRLCHYEIEVGENEQTITLEGRVAGENEKTAATEVAKSVPGVEAVVNKLEVDQGLAQALVKKQDEIITGLVRERFSKSATLKSANFEVKTEEGVVSIIGVVRFQVIALEAAETARRVPGVKAVKTDKVRLEGEG